MFKTTKILIITLLFLLSCMLLISCNQNPTTTAPSTTAEQTTPQPTPTPQTSAPNTENGDQSQTHTITYQVATPAGGTIKGELVQTLGYGQTSTAVEAIPQEGYVFLYWSDGVREALRSGDEITKDTKVSAHFKMVIPDITVPTISITTHDTDWIRTKEYVNATVKVEGTANGIFDGEFTTKIKGRGNSSWSSSAGHDDYNSKNSYRLKLDEKQKFLGIGDSKNRDWVLNSCKFDASLIRNWIGFQMGNILTGIDYSSECTWAHVYLNGDYRGVYMVVEHLEVAKDRVDIDDKVNSPDNGFLIELDMRGNHEGIEGIDYFYVDGYAVNESNAREWVIKSDLSEDPEMAKQQFEFIKNYIQKVSDTISTGDKDAIEALVDMDSLVDMFICSEFSMDVDVNTASFFMYKESGGKLHFTAPWDYDFGFGTYGVATNLNDLVSETEGGNQWFAILLQKKWFVEMVAERMAEVDEKVLHLINHTSAMGEKLAAASDKNDERWQIYGNKYHMYVSSDTSANLYCYEDHTNYLSNWMTRRWINMNGIIGMYVANLPE